MKKLFLTTILSTILIGCSSNYDVNNDTTNEDPFTHDETYVVRNPEIANYIQQYKYELEQQESFIREMNRKRLNYEVSPRVKEVFFDIFGKLSCRYFFNDDHNDWYNVGKDPNWGVKEKALIKKLLNSTSQQEKTTVTFPVQDDDAELMPLYYCKSGKKIMADFTKINSNITAYYNSAFHDLVKNYNHQDIKLRQGTSTNVVTGAQFHVYVPHKNMEYSIATYGDGHEETTYRSQVPFLDTIYFGANIYSLYLADMPSTWKVLQDLDKFFYTQEGRATYQQELEKRKRELTFCEQGINPFGRETTDYDRECKSRLDDEDIFFREDYEAIASKQKEYKYTLNYILSHKPFDYSKLPRKKIYVDTIISHEMTHQNYNVSDIEKPPRDMLRYTKGGAATGIATGVVTKPYHEWHADMTAFSYLKTVYPEWEVKQLYDFVRNSRIMSVTTANWSHRTGSYFDKIPFDQIHDFNRCGSILSPYSDKCLN